LRFVNFIINEHDDDDDDDDDESKKKLVCKRTVASRRGTDFDGVLVVV